MKLATASAAILLLSATSAQAQEAGTFTLSQHGTVIATETFRRTADRLETELTIPSRVTIRTTGSLNADATFDRVEVRVFAPGGEGDALQSSGVAFVDGKATPEQPIGTARPAMEVPAGTITYVNPSPTFMEQILRRARAAGGSSVVVPLLLATPTGLRVEDAAVTFAPGKATLMIGGVAVEAVTDDAGRFLSGTVPSQGLVITRE